MTTPEMTASPGETLARLPRQRVAFALVGVLLATFLSAASQTSIATAMPNIVADLSGFDQYTWAATAYLVAAALAAPVGGRLSDLYGRRSFFIVGMSIFVAGSILAGFSQSMTHLVAARAVQGIGGGILMANCVAAIANLFEPQQRGKFQGLVGAVNGLGSVVGPVLGGYITDHFDWTWVFLVNVPAGVVVLLILLRFPESGSATRNRKVDYAGIAILALTLTPIMVALSWAGAHHPWTSPQVLGLLVLGLAMGGALVWVESRAEYPIVPLAIYRNRTVVSCIAVTALTGFGMYSCMVLAPLFLQGALGSSASGSGQFLTALMLGLVAGTIVSGQLLSRTGGHYRIQAVAATALMAVGVYLLSTMSNQTGPAQVALYLVMVGLGFGGALSVMNVAVQNSLPAGNAGVGAATLQFYRIAGGSLGLAVLGAVMTGRFASRLEIALPAGAESTALATEIDALKHDPGSLNDPATIERLRAGFTQLGPEGGQLADTLTVSMKASLASAVGDAFFTGAVIVALAILAALFLPGRASGADGK